MTCYQRRISGPLLDCFDLFIEVSHVGYCELTDDATGDPSEAVRAVQGRRFAGTGYVTNAEMGPLEVREHCQARLAERAQPLLAAAMEQLALSARAFHRVLKVARTVADLAGSKTIEAAHLAEAVQYRRRGSD